MNDAEGRQRLALAVQADRGRIYRTVDKARIAAEVSRGAWENVEAGRRVRQFTLAAIEEALAWPPGRAERIIAGTDIPPETPDAELRRTVLNSNLDRARMSAILAILDSTPIESSTESEGRETG